jgi:hypothetical protein
VEVVTYSQVYEYPPVWYGQQAVFTYRVLRWESLPESGAFPRVVVADCPTREAAEAALRLLNLK